MRYLGRILEHALQQFDDRRILRPRLGVERAKIHGLAHVRAQLAREIGDLLGAPVDAVYGLEHLVLVGQDRLDVALEEARDFVVSEQVGGIGHRHQVGIALVLQQQRAEAPRLRLGQQARHLGIDVVIFKVEVGDLELLGQCLGNTLLRREAVLDQQPAEFAAMALLLVEGQTQLFLGNQLFLDEQIADASFLWPSHVFILDRTSRKQNRMSKREKNGNGKYLFATFALNGFESPTFVNLSFIDKS